MATMPRRLSRIFLLASLFVAVFSTLHLAPFLHIQAGSNGSISGTVTAGPDVTISVFNVWVCPTDGGGCVGTAQNTDIPFGAYTINDVLPGDYTVEFSSSETFIRNSFKPEYFNDTSSLRDATVITVGAGQAVMGIDAVVTKGASISGSVTDAQKKPLEGVVVHACTTDSTNMCNERGYASETDAQGNFKIIALDAGSYLVWFEALGQLNQFYPSLYYPGTRTTAGAAHLSVVRDGALEGINISLPDLPTISGKITDENGSPLGGVAVTACPGGLDLCHSNAVSENNGNYRVPIYEPGSYVVHFRFSEGNKPYLTYPDQYYDHAPTRKLARVLVLGEGESASGINARRDLEGRISGQIFGTNGSSVAYVDWSLCRWENNVCVHIKEATSNASGEYIIWEILRGDYRLLFRQTTGEHEAEFYDGALSAATAMNLHIESGTVISDINPTLDEAVGPHRIGGTVSNADGAPLAGILAYVCSFPAFECDTYTATDAEGKYEMTLPRSDLYVVRFTDPSGEYARLYYPGVASLDEAERILVRSDTPQMNIDGVLAPTVYLFLPSVQSKGSANNNQ